MKKIEEMSHEEIVALTDADIQILTEIECAERGVKKAMRPKPLAPLAPPQLAGTLYCTDPIRVDSREAAEAIEACLQANIKHLRKADDRYISPPGEFMAVLEDGLIDIRFKSMSALTKETYTQWSEKHDAYHELEKEYDSAEEQFKKAKKEIEAIAKPVIDTYVKHLHLEDTISMLKRELARYLQLAEGDKAIALRFFDNTYPADYDEVKEYFNAESYLTKLVAQQKEESKDAN